MASHSSISSASGLQGAPRRAAGLLLMGLLAACSSGLGALAPLGLSNRSTAALIGHPEQRQPLKAELERLFGAPNSPRFAAPPAGIQGDPRAPGLGQLGLPVEQAIAADNRQRWAELIADLARQPFSALRLPQDLGSPPSELLARAEADSAGWREDFSDWVEGRYPSLRDSALSYQRNCATCHGREGGGDGPSATFLNPKPRDYRSGEFKYFDSGARKRPSQFEMLTILHKGVAGTGMPSFKSRPAAELSGLIDYVRFLSVRGAVEAGLAEAIGAGQPAVPALADRLYTKALAAWIQVPLAPER